LVEKKVLSLLSLVYRNEEDSLGFHTILKSGFINPRMPYLLLKTEFSGAAGPGGTLTS
jgi:hypothetical protein